MSKLQKTYYWVMIVCAILITMVIISSSAFAQEDEIWSDPYPAEIIKEIRESGESHDIENDGYDYDDLGPFKLAQMMLVPEGTQPPKAEEDVTQEEKDSAENLQFMCKAIPTDGCLQNGYSCAKYSQTAKTAVACWDDFYECLTILKKKCEDKHPIPEQDESLG